MNKINTKMNTLLRHPKLLALALIVSWNFLLIGYRIHLTGNRMFLFFVWNLFLAVLPFLSSEVACYFSSKNKRVAALSFVLFTILFLPNAPYIITDLFHLRQREEIPLWFDTMVIYSVASSGLALFYVALFSIRKVITRYWGRFWAEAMVVLVAFLCSFGIYLGRYLRFNSWDVLSNPNELFEGIADRLINSSIHTRTVGVTLLYGAFLLVGYWVILLYQMANAQILKHQE